ncbi:MULTISPECIES: helix-turn-helix domain-containing protein [unclassified Phaeobacter]|uniref:helix-turn-helix domain-containing protein n=1 Tax=unclassified Phaeobacter TaxID=2621772 RepID=UPI003A8A62C5
MPMLPIPAFAAIVLAYLAARTFMSEGRPLLVAFLTACAVQSLLVALVLGYDIAWLRPVLPVSATVIPPLAWITLQDALISRISLRQTVLHGAAPSFTLFCRVFAPETTDIVVPLVFTGYGCAILYLLHSATDMPLARLDAGRVPKVLWQVLGWALIASALSDVLIAVAFMTGNEKWAGWLITFSSSLVLVLLGLLSGSPSAAGVVGEDPDEPAPRPRETSKEDIEILEVLETFLRREPMHLDPNLSLSRLSRRLHLPEKRLSMAVNRATGVNVSRYINSWRIRHACKLIEDGATVTDAMLDSGFNTKSNFNREFVRETGVPPSQWKRGVQPSANVARIFDAGKGV